MKSFTTFKDLFSQDDNLLSKMNYIVLSNYYLHKNHPSLIWLYVHTKDNNSNEESTAEPFKKLISGGDQLCLIGQ